jgi:hypothetical protein
VRAAWWQEKQDEVVDRSRCRVAAHGWSLHAGFVAVHHKTVGVTWLRHKTKTEGLAGGDEIRVRRETSKRRTRVGVARLASRLSEVRSPNIHPMVLRREFLKCPSGACILVLCNRGSFVFLLPPYKLRGERMAAISWNPSSLPFPIFPSIFLRFSIRLA